MSVHSPLTRILELGSAIFFALVDASSRLPQLPLIFISLGGPDSFPEFRLDTQRLVAASPIKQDKPTSE